MEWYGWEGEREEGVCEAQSVWKEGELHFVCVCERDREEPSLMQANEESRGNISSPRPP